MSYKVYAELSPKPFLPGDKIDVVTSNSASSFYINLEDWDGRYKFFIEIDQRNNTLKANELFDGNWQGEFKIATNVVENSDDTVLQISYKEDGRYQLKFNGCDIELKSSYWPGEVRQVGGEADDLEVIFIAGDAHSAVDGSQSAKIEDDLVNEMLA